MSIVLFATARLLITDFDDEYSTSSYLERIENISSLGGSTGTGRAMRFVARNLINEPTSGRRPDTPALVIIVTDGVPTDDLSLGQELFDSGATVYAVGVADELGAVPQALLTDLANGVVENTFSTGSAVDLARATFVKALVSESVCAVPTPSASTPAPVISDGKSASCREEDVFDVVLMLDSSSRFVVSY